MSDIPDDLELIVLNEAVALKELNAKLWMHMIRYRLTCIKAREACRQVAEMCDEILREIPG